MADVALYPGHTNVPHEKRITFIFYPDAGNAPTVPTAPLNLHIDSIEYVSTGVFRITLQHAYKNHVMTKAQVNGAITGVARYAQGGPVANVGTATPATVDIVIVDGSGSPANMAAAATDSFVSGEIVFCDTAGV
jgi:hypothetical protein